MSGHSKWSSIKHKKGKQDAKRGQMFAKLARAITVAARDGGGNPDMNAALEQAIDKAKAWNMPADNIERAVKRGTGEIEGAKYESATYEGFGHGGVALLVEVMTDNRNRAAADVRHVFDKMGGKLGATGGVGWMFERKGHILVAKDQAPAEDELLEAALEAGAEDLRDEGDQWEIVTSYEDLGAVRKALESQGLGISTAEITMLPKDLVSLDADQARRVLRLVEALEELDDVQEVFSNFDVSDEILDEMAR